MTIQHSFTTEHEGVRIAKLYGTNRQYKEQCISLFYAECNPNMFPRADYLSAVSNSPIGPYTRRMLTRWIFKTAREADVPCPSETAALAINYLDRCLATWRVRLSAMQRLAATCLMIATKLAHGERAAAEPQGGIAIDPQTELVVLRALRWRLLVPTPMCFLPILAKLFLIDENATLRCFLYLEEFIVRAFQKHILFTNSVAQTSYLCILRIAVMCSLVTNILSHCAHIDQLLVDLQNRVPFS